MGMYNGIGEFFVSFCNCLLIKKKSNEFLSHCYQFGNAVSDNSQLLLPVEHCRGSSIETSRELDYHVKGVVLHQSFCRDVLNQNSAYLYYLEALKCIGKPYIFVNIYRKHGRVKDKQRRKSKMSYIFFKLWQFLLCHEVFYSGLSRKGLVLFQMIVVVYL